MVGKILFLKAFNNVLILFLFGLILVSSLANPGILGMDDEESPLIKGNKPIYNSKQIASKETKFWKCYGFKKKEYRHVAALIEKTLYTSPYIYTDTAIITERIIFQGAIIEKRMWGRQDDLSPRFPWVSLACPLAKGQEEFLRSLLFSLVSRFYADPLKVDLLGLGIIKQYIGELIFHEEAGDMEKKYIRDAILDRRKHNITTIGNALTLIHDTDSPLLGMNYIVNAVIKSRRKGCVSLVCIEKKIGDQSYHIVREINNIKSQ